MKRIITFSKFLLEKINIVHPYIIILLILLFLTGSSWLTKDYLGTGGDVAEYCNNPVRVLDGQFPYLDFYLIYSPGEVLIPALIYKAFGTNIDIMRFVSILISVFSTIIAFSFGKKLFKTNNKAIIFTLVYFYASVIFYYVGPDYIHLFYIFIFSSAFCIYLFFENNKNIFLYLSGLLIGIALFFRYYEVMAAGLAIYLVQLYYLWSTKDNKFKALLHSLTFVSGMLTMIMIYIIIFFNKLPVMYSEIVIESVGNGTGMSLPYFFSIIPYFNSLTDAFAKLTHSFSIVLIIKLFYYSFKILISLFIYLLPLISIIGFIGFLRQRPGIKEISIALIFILWSLISFPKAMSRSDLAHLAPSLTPALFFILYIAWNNNKANWTKNFRYFANIVIVPALIIALGAGLTSFTRSYQLFSKPVNKVTTEYGTVTFRIPAEKDNFKNVINYIDSSTTKDDYIFVTVWDAPPVYALTGRKNPTYYDSMNDLVVRYSDVKQKKIISDLINKKTKLIIHNPDWGYDNKPDQTFRTACDILQNFFDNHCEVVAKFGVYQILKIKNDNYQGNI